MHLKTRNVNTAFQALVGLFADPSMRGSVVQTSPSRNGPVLMVNEPVTITYERPLERVLLNRSRNANPFFHLYHALWLLAGRRDVAAPAHYAKRYADYSDDGTTSNGSYGERWWRRYPSKGGGDLRQMTSLIEHLRRDRATRRAVLQMWNAEDDLFRADTSRDVCCNLSVMFSIRGENPRLDVTVTNRSNDLVWGTLGEDYVTFSILQEYVAAHLSVEVGVYNQFSNNLHVYENNFRPTEWLRVHAEENGVQYCKPFPLVKDPAAFDREVGDFVELNKNGKAGRDQPFREPFLAHVAQPMCRAWRSYKERDFQEAFNWCARVQADDWRTACAQWMERRQRGSQGKAQ